MMLALSLKDFTINNIFGGLNMVQVVLFFVAMLFVMLFGMMIGGAIFYPLAIKNYRKTHKNNQTAKKERVKKEEAEVNTLVEQMETKTVQKPVTLVDLSDADMDISNMEFEDDENENESPVTLSSTTPNAKSQDNVVDVTPISTGDAYYEQADKPASVAVDPLSLLEDPDFKALVNKRKKEVPVLPRRTILKYIKTKLPALSDENDVNIALRSLEEGRPYDVVSIGKYPFLYLLSYKNVIKIFLRLHPNTYKSTASIIGAFIKPYPSIGADWYEWVLTDLETLSMPLKAIVASYKYTSAKEFKQEGNVITSIGKPYAEQAYNALMQYSPVTDTTYQECIAKLNAKYDLKTFDSADVCNYTRAIQSELSTPSVEESPGNRPALLKTGNSTFCIVFEEFGVLKLIFRNDESFVDALRAKHDYVKVSPFPESKEYSWYSILIDDTYDVAEIKSIIDSCYRYVENYNNEYIDPQGEEDED